MRETCYIYLTPADRVKADALAHDETVSFQRRTRARILLLSDRSVVLFRSHAYVANKLGITAKTVYNVAREFNLYGVDHVLRPRKGSKTKFKEGNP